MVNDNENLDSSKSLYIYEYIYILKQNLPIASLVRPEKRFMQMYGLYRMRFKPITQLLNGRQGAQALTTHSVAQI
jgi:hypothetical protein